MTLTEDLANLSAQMQSKIPEDVQQIIGQAGLDLLTAGILDRPLRESDKIPNFSLPNAIGKFIQIQDPLKSGLLVISFYRGGWCPYCNLELRSLQKMLPEILANGGTLVAISPETPDNSLSTVVKNQLSFEVLSDRGNQVARQFGLVFTVPEILLPIYHQFGIDLPVANGDETFELPIPATYVVKSDGAIAHAFVNPDYTQRLDPTEIITILRKLKVTA